MTQMLPTIDPMQPSETSQEFGFRVLAFLMRENCYVTLPNEALEQAERAAQLAVAARDISQPALKQVSNVRHQIALMLEFRKRLVLPMPEVKQAMTPQPRSNSGHSVRLTPPKPRKGPPTALALPEGYAPL